LVAAQLVFDLTEVVHLAQNSTRPFGIARVQLGVAAILAEEDRYAIEFCRYDHGAGIYETVPRDLVLELAATMRGYTLPATQASSRPRRPGSALNRRDVLAALSQRSVKGGEHAREAFRHARTSWREARATVSATRADARRRRREPECASSVWSAHTMYCSVGSDWLHGNLDYLAQRRRELGFQVALTVYDLVPVVAPQYTSMTVDFAGHLVDVLRNADVVAVPSRATLRDLEEFAAKHELGVPKVLRMPLGSEVADESPAVPDLFADPGSGLRDARFVLCVGTVEIRKNHQLLLDVWEMLVAELGTESCPKLVVAGQRGWLASETLARLTRTPTLAEAVTFIEAPTDRELAWLYTHCEFTAYPSRQEGWGLPVAESLDFGKLCLTTNASSLPEAGEGLSVLLDPFDRVQWKGQILDYWEHPEKLRAKEEEIVGCHRRVTARDTADAILGRMTDAADHREWQH
jgi:hypothetical protein